MNALLKFWPYIAGFILIGSAGLYIHHCGVATGRAQIQLKFDAFVRASEALAAKQIAANERALQKAENTNAQTIATLSSQRNNAVAAGRVTSDKLREYIAKANSRPVPETNNQPGTDGAAQDGSLEELGQAAGNLRTECAENADQLRALQAELAPQL